jgi:hypothetical protein
MDVDYTDDEYLLRLQRRVETEIRDYVYEFPDTGMIGNRMPDAWVAEGLAQMRTSLVNPYWVEVEVRDTIDQIEMDVPISRKSAVVADDGKGTVLLFDPVAGEFMLAQPGAKRLETFGVRGDAVGCFLAR